MSALCRSNTMILEQARTQGGQTNSGPRALNALGTLGLHWPEYVMEGVELGLYMISACAFVVLVQYPTSPVHQALPDSTLRRVLFGIAMGVTAIGIIYSPLGQRSGAHFNPAVTLTFFRLGKVEFWDAAFYGAEQFIGGLLGVVLSALVLGELVAHPPCGMPQLSRAWPGSAWRFSPKPSSPSCRCR